MIDYSEHRKNLINKTMIWHSSDREDNYLTKNEFGPNLFTPESFDYQFNSHGFRCDEFHIQSDLPIVFLGCSFTEGEGLPVESTWAYHLLVHIRNKTKKNIPFWNLATSGGNLDMNAGLLANFIDQLRPKYIFYLRPPWMRRTVFLSKDNIQNWLPEIALSTNPNAKHIPRYFSESFAEEAYAVQQVDRSLTIINLLAEKYNTTVYHLPWQPKSSETAIQPTIDSLSNFIQINSVWTPKIDVARDSLHPGPKTHELAAKRMWDSHLNHIF